MTKVQDLVLRGIVAAFVVAAVSLFWISIIVLHGQEKRRIVGDYTCHGVVADKTYAAAMEIRVAGDTYRIRQLTQGVMTFDGVGLEMDGYVAVLFASRNGLAVSIYKAEGRTLSGAWTGGDGVVFQEVCTRADLGA